MADIRPVAAAIQADRATSGMWAHFAQQLRTAPLPGFRLGKQGHRPVQADVQDVVVHVRSVRSGEMDIYRGTSHARVTDRDLAARLARASK